MKFLISVIFLMLLISCSFDDKTGIWKNEQNIISEKSDNIFKDFKDINLDNKNYFEEIV